MTATPQTELESRLKTLDDAVENDEIATEDAEAIRAVVTAYNPDDLMETPPDDETTTEVGTCNVYLSRLTEAARHFTITDATADEVNRVLQDLTDDPEITSAWTVHGYATAFRKFYGFHEFGPDPDDIARIDTPDGATFDEDDVLTREEIHEMLDAADNPRDRAVFALLVFTGMRNNALRTLRVGDVNVERGSWSANGDMDGLKGLDEAEGNARPLLAAKKPVREWLQYHPASNDDDAYLITGRPKYGRADPSTPVAGSTIRRVMDRLVENTGNPEIQRKPTHPHMMRHVYVTVCVRDYEMEPEDVKRHLGHSPASKIMETTYSHLSDEDFIRRAEEAAGIRDPDAGEAESPLTPEACDTCGEPLAPSAKACPACGDVFAPNAEGAAAGTEAIDTKGFTPEMAEKFLEQAVEGMKESEPELFDNPDAWQGDDPRDDPHAGE